MDDKKKINQIWVESETWAWLVEQANRRGELIADFTGALLDEAIIHWQPPQEDEPERRIYWAWLGFIRDKQRRERIYQAASMYKENPTEEMADALAQMCEDGGLDYREVIKEVERDPFSSLIANSRNGSVLGECIRWLTKLLQEHPEGIPVRIAKIIAEKEGFSSSTMKRARGAINADLHSPSILSHKVGHKWVMKMDNLESDLVDDPDNHLTADSLQIIQ